MGQTKSQQAKEGKHVRVYRKQMNTAAWREASGSAVKVMLAMMLFDNGENNGAIYFSDRVGAEMTGLSRNTVWKALRQLQELGFAYCTERGGFSRKTRHAACYGLTWLAGPRGTDHRAPSHAYERWQPVDGNTRSQNLTATGPVSNDCVETPTLTGADIGPVEMEKPVVSAKVDLSGIGPQTVYQGDRSERLETDQRKQAIPTSGRVSSLRDLVKIRLLTAEPGEQSRMATAAGIPGGTLSKFIGGRNLPDRYVEPLAAMLEAHGPRTFCAAAGK